MKNVENTNDCKRVLVSKLTYELPVLRARLGISQAELATTIGISRQTYNSIETGKRDMPWTTFMALIAVFQNNDETRKMINSIDGLEDAIGLYEHKTQGISNSTI